MSDVTTNRPKVKIAEVTGAFLVEKVGKEWAGGQYGPSYPVEVLLSDSTAAVMWVNSNSVCGRQLSDGEIAEGQAYTVESSTSKTGRDYRAFRPAE